MIFNRKTVGAITLLIAFTSASYAQVCKESSGGRTGIDCDMSYRDTIVTCDPINKMIDPSPLGQTKTVGTRSACPAKPMPMIDTPLKSYIKDYSPYLFAYARDKSDKTKAYTGEFYRGSGGQDQVFNLFGNAAGATGAKLAPCKMQIRLPSDASSLEDQAKAVRLQLDNCANQYILQSALTPVQKALTNQLSGENPAHPSETTSIQTECQPLKTVKELKNEYDAGEYIEAAWKKLLKDPTYRKNKDAEAEPHLPDGIKIENPIPPPASMPEIRLSNIADVKSEEIIDPSHPFSPRWDYKYNDRDHYSPKTASYSGDSKNAVFCAGNKDSMIAKVDILTFREKKLDFDKKLMKRIDFNKNCMANTGPQMNPCCKVNHHGTLDVTKWTCDVQPCAKCYKMTAEDPVCSTNHARITDRKKVVNKYLPVHPALRVGNGLQSLQSMALSKLPGGTLVGNVTNMLSGQLAVASLLDGALPVRNLGALMSGQLDAAKFINDNFKDMALNQVSGMIGIPTDMINNLTSFADPRQLESMLHAQLDLVKNLGPLGDVNRMIATLGSTEALMAQIPGVRDLNGMMPYLNGQATIMDAINTRLPIGKALATVDNYQDMLNNLGQGVSIADAVPLIKGQSNMLSQMLTRSPTATFNNLKESLTGQLDQFARVPSTLSLGDAMKISGIRIDANLGDALRSLPLSTPMSQVNVMLNSQLSGIQGFAPNELISGYVNDMKNQASNLTSIAGTIAGGNAGGLGAMLGGISSSANNMIQQGMSLADFPSALKTSMSSITGITGNPLLQDVGTTLSSLKGGLNSLNLTGALPPLGDLSRAMSGQVNSLLSAGLGQGLNVGQIGTLFQQQGKMINGFMAMGESKIAGVQNMLNGQLSGLAGLNPLTSINQVTGALNSQLSGLLNASPLAGIGSFAQGLDAQLLGSLGNVSSLMNLQGIGNMIPGLSNLTSALSSFPGINGLTGLGSLTSSISASIASGIGSMTAGLSSSLSSLTSGLTGGLSNLAANIPGMSALNALSGGIPALRSLSALNPNPCSIGPNYIYLCVKMMYFPRQAKCNPNEFGDTNKPSMTDLCKQLRAPYTNLNKLKMRYHNPDDRANMVLKEGVQEGLKFKDYFDDTETKIAHMPYPMLWDTGRSIQKTDSADQQPLDTMGQYTAIVGVGREAAPESAGASTPAASSPAPATPGSPAPAASASDKHKDERCLLGGWGSDRISVGGVNIKVPDPVTSWTELKLYQTRALRNSSLSCIPRYEKVYKPGSTENGVLAVSGGEYQRMVISVCPKDKTAEDCKFMTLKEYKDSGATGGTVSTDDKKIVQMLQQGFANAWRGYISSKNDATRFPKFGGSASLIKGLDKAELGDIVIMPKGSGKSGGKPGLAKIGLVVEANTPTNSDCATAKRKNCYVKVMEFDNGKWPDVCGTTDSWGENKTRYMYKPGNVPDILASEMTGISWTSNCEDTKLSQCELTTWNDLELYRIRDDERKACSKERADLCDE